ncbi:MAG TPA: helix-turn-helix transcriptional regulator [Thermoanaerobaculia bacterium]|nr:helix-turn-helix transcriptional regulator [Thermoanaerobaculia bacterium]
MGISGARDEITLQPTEGARLESSWHALPVQVARRVLVGFDESRWLCYRLSTSNAPQQRNGPESTKAGATNSGLRISGEFSTQAKHFAVAFFVYGTSHPCYCCFRMGSRTEFYADVGKKIRAARKLRGLGQKELAVQLSLSRESISNIEKGRHAVQLHVLFEIAMILGVAVVELLPEAVVPGLQEGASPRDQFVSRVLRGTS